MITNLRAQNFKSWKDTGDLRLAPLTGLFGTNSSGKSSILQVLLMMKQTAESSDPSRVLHLGGDLQSYCQISEPSSISSMAISPATERSLYPLHGAYPTLIERLKRIPLRFEVGLTEREETDHRFIVSSDVGRDGYHGRGMVSSNRTADYGQLATEIRYSGTFGSTSKVLPLPG